MTKDQETTEEDSPAHLTDIREEINNIDTQILELLSKRRGCSNRIASSKEVGTGPVRDRAREEELLVERIQGGKQHGLDSHFITKVFHEIIDDSLRVQQEYLQRRMNADAYDQQLVRIAFQGIEGAYSHLAAQQYFSGTTGQASYVGCQTFKSAMQAVEKGQADFAILPIENTTSGGINDVYDLLLHTQLSIVGEEKLRVDHCLLGIEGAEPREIKKVYCHPQTTYQCSRFLGELNCKVEFFADLALPDNKLKDLKDPNCGVIASEEAARVLGLEILKRDIADHSDNFTRFIVVARKSIQVDRRIPCKTSIVMSTGQRPGSLLKALQVFHAHNINLTKLESRPILGNPWEEMFYVDLGRQYC